MLIKSKDYFNSKVNNERNYNIIVVKTKNEIIEMISYFKKFIKLVGKKKYASLDFEFNSSPDGKKIALFQINLENDNDEGTIYLFYPPDLNDNQINVLINLLIDKDIKKIVHGAESLDIPYLFKNIFTNNSLRTKFCNNLFDTRYLCEYYHIENGFDTKCKIYHILREMNVINDDQLKMLLKNEEDMGPIYLIEIDVRNLNDFTMLYSAFDVLYLSVLLEQFPDRSIYTKLIPEITCFNYIDRYENIFSKPFFELISRGNNYYVKSERGNIKLISIYQLYYYWLDDDKKILSKLMEINYFKKFIETYIKYIVYKNMFKRYEIWENSNKKSNLVNEIIKLEKQFEKNNLSNYFENYFKIINKTISDSIERL